MWYVIFTLKSGLISKTLTELHSVFVMCTQLNGKQNNLTKLCCKGMKFDKIEKDLKFMVDHHGPCK